MIGGSGRSFGLEDALTWCLCLLPRSEGEGWKKSFEGGRTQRRRRRVYLLTALAIALAGCQNVEAPVEERTPPATHSVSAATTSSFAPLFDDAIAGGKTALRIDERVSQSQLQLLTRLPELRTLQLDGGVATTADLTAIPDLPELKHLRVRETAIDAAALQDIASRFKSLEILNLPQFDIAAADTQALLELQSLQSLRIGGRRIDGEMLKVISGLPQLLHLHLIGPALVDEDLRTVAGIESLRSFYLDDCRLTDDAWVEFFKLRPNIHVHIDQSHRDYDPNAHP